MFAVIQTGGKQYRVSPGQKLKIEKLAAPGGGEPRHRRAAKEGDKVFFDKVLLIADGDNIKVGAPYIEAAKIEANVLRQARDKKKIVFRYHSKTRYRKKKGHRQHFTEIEIAKIPNI